MSWFWHIILDEDGEQLTFAKKRGSSENPSTWELRIKLDEKFEFEVLNYDAFFERKAT